MTDQAWGVDFTPRGKRDLDRLDRQVRQRVYTALQRLAAAPGTGQLHKLTGRTESRLRVGDWRILVELDHRARTIVVHHVLPRGRAYDR
jgi:mRNA-degrading endonuclease RelE of RelBE toxin-antitoxin system